MHTRRFETASTGWRVIVPLAGRLKRSRVPAVSSPFISAHEAPGETCQAYVTDPPGAPDAFSTRQQLVSESTRRNGQFKAYRGMSYVGNPLNLLLVIVYVPTVFPRRDVPDEVFLIPPRSLPPQPYSSPREKRFLSSSGGRSF